MYTGIVAGTGAVAATEPDDEGHRLRIETNGHADPAPGDSVAIDGVCLTATAVGEGWFDAFLSEETVARTALPGRAVGDPVNVESPLSLGDTLDGHLVRGCVETTTELLAVASTGSGWRFEFAIPDGFEVLLVEQGGVAIDGASLTVAELVDDRETASTGQSLPAERVPRFAVAVIPETYERTTLSERSPGDRVHVEADPIAKYVARQRQVA